MDVKVLGRIMIDSKEGRCFFHVLGDYKEFYDIECMERAHPEEKAFIELNRYDLERALCRKREEMETAAV